MGSDCGFARCALEQSGCGDSLTDCELTRDDGACASDAFGLAMLKYRSQTVKRVDMVGRVNLPDVFDAAQPQLVHHQRSFCNYLN